MPRGIVALLLAVLGSAAAAGVATRVQGVASYVTDGDTLWLRPYDGGRPLKLRLVDIDAPEICQAGGPEARQALADRVAARPLVAEIDAQDDYGRGLARLWRDGVDINEELVRSGHAWSHRFRGRPGRYDAAEAQARAARRGVFAEADPVEPRVFRRRHGPCSPPPSPRP